VQKVSHRKKGEAADLGADDDWARKETKEALKGKTKPITRTADRKGHRQRPFVYSKSFLVRTNIDTLVASVSFSSIDAIM
jgi:hypothetical protein